MHNLLSYQLVRLRACLSCHAPGGLYRCGTKRADKPGSNFKEGSSAELGICSRPVWVSAYRGKLSQRPSWKWWIFLWIFAVDVLVTRHIKKSAEKIHWKIHRRKQKIAGARPPPKSTSQAQKSTAKPTNKSACQTSKHMPAIFRLRRFSLGGIFRAWILGHSLAAFCAWSRFPC